MPSCLRSVATQVVWPAVPTVRDAIAVTVTSTRVVWRAIQPIWNVATVSPYTTAQVIWGAVYAVWNPVKVTVTGTPLGGRLADC